jgi:endonuclease YncB( thermonuclease family)
LVERDRSAGHRPFGYECVKIVRGVRTAAVLQHWCAAALLFFAVAGLAYCADIVGNASIIDGDTLEIHGARIRLWGVDAPESGQLCGGRRQTAISLCEKAVALL